MGQNEYKLKEEILARSVAKTWDEAKREWYLFDVYWSEDCGTCLCTHYPIREFCKLSNSKNNRTCVVGNCCVKKFMGGEHDAMFDSIARVQRDISKSFSDDLIWLAKERGVIDEWQYKFLMNTWRKRKLSEKQRMVRERINKKLLAHFKAKKLEANDV